MTPIPTKPLLAAPGNYRTLDAVRGLASLWVVFFHGWHLLLAPPHPALSEATAASPWLFLFRHGNLGVSVFFVVSGYCIINAAVSGVNKPWAALKFAQARLRRILPPCWASLLCFITASLLAVWWDQRHGTPGSTSLSRLDLAHQSWTFFLSNFTLTQVLFQQGFISVVCWTLCYEVAFYLIVWVVLVSVRLLISPTASLPRAEFLLGTLHLVTITCGVLLILQPQLLSYPFDLWLQFGLGIAVFDAHRNYLKAAAPPGTTAPAKPRLLGRGYLWLGAILALLIVFLLSQEVLIGSSKEWSRLTYGTALLTAPLLLIGRYFDARLFTLAPLRWAAWIGAFSYSLYLINFLLLSVMVKTYGLLHLSTAWDVVLYVPLVLLTLPPAYLFYRLFEKPFLGRRTARPNVPLHASQKVVVPPVEAEPVPLTAGSGQTGS